MTTTKQAQIVATILSEIIATATIPATTTKFVAKDKFVVDISEESRVKISRLGNNFKEWFLGKCEDPFSGGTVYGRKINKGSVDGPILTELGGQEKAETTLTETYAMMSAQPNGKSGDLLNNGFANVFYVRDINNTLRAVRLNWDGDGWIVDAHSVKDPIDWHVRYRVFCRNSLAA